LIHEISEAWCSKAIASAIEKQLMTSSIALGWAVLGDEREAALVCEARESVGTSDTRPGHKDTDEASEKLQ
jgi:hypothetical protein